MFVQVSIYFTFLYKFEYCYDIADNLCEKKILYFTGTRYFYSLKEIAITQKYFVNKETKLGNES